MHGSHEKRYSNLRLVHGAARPALPSIRSAPRTGEGGLAAAVLDRDRAALGELVRGNGAMVLAIVRRYARISEDARDLVERTFLRAFRAARRALDRDPERALPFRRWLVRLATKLAKHHLRREVYVAGASLEQLGPADPDAQARSYPGGEPASRVRNEVLLLPRRQREVLTLRIDAELPFSDVAQCLGITEDAAIARLHDAMRRLRGALGPGAATSACPRYEVLLSLRGVGALEPSERARVEAHLAGCVACGAEADATAEALALATLAPACAAERAVLDELPARTLAALERFERRRVVRKHVLIAASVAVILGGVTAALLAGGAGWP